MNAQELKLVKYDFRGNTFYFYNTPTINALINEIFNDNYRVLQYGLKFGPRDVIIDIGANEGVFSIMMAKLFPDTTIISLEPVLRTYQQFLSNIAINHVKNIMTLRYGVGGSNREEIMIVNDKFSGGSSSMMSMMPEHYQEQVKIITLEKLFHAYDICDKRRCSLLKMDIEGMEHEAVEDTKILKYVDNMVAEIHINARIESKGYSIERFVKTVEKQTKLVHFETCKMSE